VIFTAYGKSLCDPRLLSHTAQKLVGLWPPGHLGKNKGTNN